MADLYILGDPVAHSLSPAMQNAAFEAVGLPHRYHLMEVHAADLPAAVHRIRAQASLGANVTIPHKEVVAPLLDGVEGAAARLGAVNTLFKRDERLLGENTDAGGFEDALAEMDVDLRGCRVLVLGAGGAARACADRLVAGGAHLVVTNRTRARLDALVRSLPYEVGRSVAAVWPPPRSLDGYDAVVNATSLGLHGEDALDGVPMRRDLAVADVVATADETPLIRRAKASGCVVVDGLLMLLHQGTRAFRLWTGRDAPVAAMRAALPRRI